MFDDASKAMQFGGNTIDELSTLIINLYGEAAVPHISSYKNCETVVAFLSLNRFASDNLLQ